MNSFISGKILTPGRNLCNPTLLEHSMKNKCRALKKIVRRELNDAASSNPTVSIRDLSANPSGQTASFHGQTSNPFGLSADAFGVAADSFAPSANFHDASSGFSGLSCWSIIATSGSFGVSVR
jgi:hypothetical protein